MEKPAVIWKPIVWESLVGSLFKMRGETTQMRGSAKITPITNYCLEQIGLGPNDLPQLSF